MSSHDYYNQGPPQGYGGGYPQQPPQAYGGPPPQGHDLQEAVTDVSRLALLRCAAASFARRVASAVLNAASAASKQPKRAFHYERYIK
ncbi:hypothetical protein O1611_g7454 [Lasiodiplodia mahajangana]|uniref:Uncharacterized protein n=1 Tax=Lasiodiplodia mahajangana TaxID=1108764 RepID=A0ACC2JFL8_9PEZI|nr:hypothetical protein O1611_g7454 [Lasiodiplodia mahajangana]